MTSIQKVIKKQQIKMKTKDLIKLLQEEDPSGETHVRIQGGAISHCEGKPGYWDGNYSYFDENGVYVTSTEDYKIDIITRDMDDVIWDLNGNMDKIKDKIRVEYTYCDKSREENIWKHVEKEAKYAKEFHQKLKKESTENVLKKVKEGWKVRYLKDGEERKYCRKWRWVKGLKRESVNFGEIQAITESGLFHPIEKRKYVYYELTEDIVNEFAEKLTGNMQDIEPVINQIVSENFSNLLQKTNEQDGK